MSFINSEIDFRNYVVGINKQIPLSDNRYVTAINFDNAATTPPFVSVLKEIVDFSPWYSSIHRGTGYKSKFSSELYESCRTTVLDFVKGDPSLDTVIFLKNTTEAINKLSYRLCSKSKKDVVLSSCMEHHSNDLPWREKYLVDYIGTDSCGRLSLNKLEALLKKYRGKVKLVTVTAASNVTGIINPIYEIAELSHKYNSKILVDGAQFIPHVSFSMLPHSSLKHIDYVAFSAHKMYAPFGTGVLIGSTDTFTQGAPEYSGGGTVEIVTSDFVSWEAPPSREEAGSPNIIGVVALSIAIKTLSVLGMDRIELHEKNLTQYALDRLRKLPDIHLYGNTQDCINRVGIIPFNIEGMYHEIAAEALSCEGGISVRNGCFCAHPYVQSLLELKSKELKKYIKDPSIPKPGMVRISFGLYNTCDEIDIFIKTLKNVIHHKSAYIEKYNSITT